MQCRLRLATCDAETCGLQGVSVPQAGQTQPRGFGRRIHSSVEVTELVPINDTLHTLAGNGEAGFADGLSVYPTTD